MDRGNARANAWRRARRVSSRRPARRAIPRGVKAVSRDDEYALAERDVTAPPRGARSSAGGKARTSVEERRVLGA